MTFTLHFGWWFAPALTMVLTLLWAFFWPADDRGYLGGVTRLLMIIPALTVSLLVWAVAGALK